MKFKHRRVLIASLAVLVLALLLGSPRTRRALLPVLAALIVGSVVATFSALLIGNETLTTECGAALLARGHRIEIRGFGSFSINRRPPRLGRNPRTGESVHIPERRVPHFKPGKALREAVGAQPVDAGDAGP